MTVADEDAKKARNKQHLEKAIATHRATRARRLAELQRQEAVLTDAVAKTQLIDASNGEPVMIPREFVALSTARTPFGLWEEAPVASSEGSVDRKRELATRPPLTRLVNRDHHAIRLLLTILYVAQQETSPGTAYINNRPNHARVTGSDIQPWSALTAVRRDGGNARARRLRLVRALQALERLGIVNPHYVDGTARWEGFDVRSADGADRAATVISTQASPAVAVAVPSGFFYNGWHLVLTPAELAMYLAIVDLTAQLPLAAEGVAFPIVVRRGIYGITDGVYQTIHMLEEFGLIDIVDTVKNRNRGKIKGFDADTKAPEPYRIVYPGKDTTNRMENPAISTVIRRLKLYPEPPRLDGQLDLDAIGARVFGSTANSG